MTRAWAPGTPGLLVLPSGRAVRGRARRDELPADLRPEVGVHLSGEEPDELPWPVLWVRWPDFRTPSDRAAARAVLVEAWHRAVTERVEVSCDGGRGRTGTALACLAVIDGVPAREAVAFVRRHYHPKAVETPWQRRYVARFVPPGH